MNIGDNDGRNHIKCDERRYAMDFGNQVENIAVKLALSAMKRTVRKVVKPVIITFAVGNRAGLVPFWIVRSVTVIQSAEQLGNRKCLSGFVYVLFESA